MAFVNEKVTSEMRKIFDLYKLKNPVTDKLIDTRIVAVDKELNAYFIPIGGQGYPGASVPDYYILIWKNSITKIAAFYHIEKGTDDTLNYSWRIADIIASEAIKDRETELIGTIITALHEYKSSGNNCHVKTHVMQVAQPVYLCRGANDDNKK